MQLREPGVGVFGMLLAPSGLGEFAEKCLVWAWFHCWSDGLAVGRRRRQKVRSNTKVTDLITITQ